MKILHSCQTVSRSFGGVFEVARQLTGELHRQNPDWHIRVLGAEDEHTAADQELWHGVEVAPYRVYGPRRAGWSLAIAGQYRSFRPDVAHVHGLWMHYGLVNLSESQRARIPWIVSPHGMLDPWALAHSTRVKRLARWLFEDRHLHGAACLHALCREEAAQLRALGLRNPICVIPNGVFLPDPSEAKLDATPWADAFPNDARILLFLGRLHPKKGIDNLLAAWSMLSNSNANAEWRLVIAGWGGAEYSESLSARIRESGLEQQVRMIGPIFGAAKGAALRAASAFILPSFSEGLPMSILEAWSYGVPVLMTKECNLTEGFDANAAVRIGTGPTEIANPLQEFLRLNEDHRKTLGRNGFELVQRRFTWVQIAEDFSRVYTSLTSENQVPPDLLAD